MPQKQLHRHIDKKLRFRLQLFFVIAFIMVCVVLYEIFTLVISVELAAIAGVIGLGIGYAVAHSSRVTWDHGMQKVITRLDVIGWVVLGVYIISAIFRRYLIGFFIHGPAVTAFSFAMVAGIMVGRVIGTRKQIRDVLKEQKIL
jgi:hypothetical protein